MGVYTVTTTGPGPNGTALNGAYQSSTDITESSTWTAVAVSPGTYLNIDATVATRVAVIPTTAANLTNEAPQGWRIPADQSFGFIVQPGYKVFVRTA